MRSWGCMTSLKIHHIIQGLVRGQWWVIDRSFNDRETTLYQKAYNVGDQHLEVCFFMEMKRYQREPKPTCHEWRLKKSTRNLWEFESSTHLRLCYSADSLETSILNSINLLKNMILYSINSTQLNSAVIRWPFHVFFFLFPSFGRLCGDASFESKNNGQVIMFNWQPYLTRNQLKKTKQQYIQSNSFKTRRWRVDQAHHPQIINIDKEIGNPKILILRGNGSPKILGSHRNEWQSLKNGSIE